MSVNVRRLAEALSTYAEGVEVTTSDVDRRQRDLHDRIGTGNRAPRRRLILAAAVLVLIVAAAAGTLWLRRRLPPFPRTRKVSDRCRRSRSKSTPPVTRTCM